MPLRSLAVAVGFLTRVPIELGDVREADLGRSLAWFPTVGLMLGVMFAGAELVMSGLGSPALVALGLVALGVGLTGGLHLDGVADVFDGLGGGRGNRQRILEIMRDSRIGAHGAAAVVLVLLAKVFAIVEIERAGMTWALIVFPAAARWAACALVICFPYARKEGLGKSFNGHARGTYLVAATCTMVAIVVLAGTSAIVPTLASLGVALLLAMHLQRRLGGLTGDVYGAAIELAEVAFLVIALAQR